MIVEPDFLDHWKTQMLIGELDDPASPCYLLRLWAHCQTRKQYLFVAGKMNPAILRAITRAPMDAQVFWDALIEVGFIDLHENGTIEVHGFYDANAQLCCNWENGKKGGRPSKKTASEKPIQNPSKTHPEPIENPSRTHSEPIEEGERGEGNEEAEKQDEGEREDESSLSPPPRKKPFWQGKDYSNVEHRTVEDYSDIRAIGDPIEAAMAVTGDYSLGMYGSLVKGCNKSLNGGMSDEGISEWLFREVEQIFGEIKAGERKRGKDAASGFTARMRDHFATVGESKQGSISPTEQIDSEISELISNTNPGFKEPAA